MNNQQELKRTPLYKRHLELGGKIVGFAGWELPVLYSGVIAEHEAVRKKAGLFDVSHMGEIFVTGSEAQAAIDSMTCNNVGVLHDGKALYSAIINERGGVVDDIIIYRISAQKFLICVNASNADKDFAWFVKHNKYSAEFTNESARYGQIALQGPLSEKIITNLGLTEAAKLKYFHFSKAEILGHPVIVARTGYTGEDGFELFIPSEATVSVWDALLDCGAKDGLIPCGLGARDTLRLEACYPLHGHELSEDISAIESGLGWVVKPEKGDFIGRDILAKQKTSGAPRSLIGFFVDDQGIARDGEKVFSESGEEIGIVTSGTKTPTVNKALGMALVNSKNSAVDNKINVEVRGRRLKSHIVTKPFYKRK